ITVSLGIVVALDKCLKKAFVAAAIKFPSALFGMFYIFSVLIILDSTIPAAANSLMSFFDSAILFIQRWLPLFYVPSLVVLPLSVQDILLLPMSRFASLGAGGCLASLRVTGFTAIAVRNMVKTEMIDAEPMAKSSHYTPLEMWTCIGIFLISFVSALFLTVLWTRAQTCLSFLLSSMVLGYIVGSRLPSDVKKFFHPIICCALSADLTAVVFGYLSRSGLDPVLGYYLARVPSNPGAGDILMRFLGSVLSFAFSMFKRRKVLIILCSQWFKSSNLVDFTSVIISTIFSFSCIFLLLLVGANSSLTSVSICSVLCIFFLFRDLINLRILLLLLVGANSSLTAAVVVVTDLIGANFVHTMLDKLQFRDPIA
ncbi:LOW QUALITY PROTEIN: hypothetical protein CFOL_v3_31575, partial [Cephalotus follicularis]